MKVRLGGLFGIALVIGYSMWFVYLAELYEFGDIKHYSGFYNTVANRLEIYRHESFVANFLDVFELQRRSVASREPAFTLVVMFFAPWCEYKTYQQISIVLLVGGFTVFLRQIVRLPWLYLNASLLSNYFLIIAIPAERLRWAFICFMWTAIFLRFVQVRFFAEDANQGRSDLLWWKPDKKRTSPNRSMNALVKGRGFYFLPAAAISTLGHIQMGGVAFLAYFSTVKVTRLSIISSVIAFILVVLAVFGQIEGKILNREAQSVGLSSALLGIVMIVALAYLSDTWRKRAFLLPWLFYGLIWGFGRINLSIWIIFFLILDYRDNKTCRVYFLLSSFLIFQMTELVRRIHEYGTAFGSMIASAL